MNDPLWEHDHTFGQDEKKPAEVRTLVVVLLTAATMVLEIVAGIVYGSMALLADGLHMASHATALTIAMVAYIYARRHARDETFSFGTGKVNSLAGFTGAILLAIFAVMMTWESVERLVAPIPIAFNQALAVAVVGLIVNGLSVFILGQEGTHDHGPDSASVPKELTHSSGATCDGHDHSHHHAHDHNLRSAYLHVLADALTSVLAVFALLAGKYFGLYWLDPVMGIVGAILVARWSFGLLRVTGGVLLDRQGPEHVRDAIRRSMEKNCDATVVDLHLWQISAGKYGLILSVVARDPKSPDWYRRSLPSDVGLVHVTVEVYRGGESTQQED